MMACFSKEGLTLLPESAENTATAFRAYIKQLRDYQSAIALLEWDARTHLPKKGIEGRSQAIGTLSMEAFRMSVSDEMGAYIEAVLANGDALDEVTVRSAVECKRVFDRNRKIPPERIQEFVVLTTTAESVWAEARAKSDFSMFAPYLEKIVATLRNFIDYWGNSGDPYDTLLDEYEPGMTVAVLDPLFSKLRSDTAFLVQQIGAKPQLDDAFLERFYDPQKQRQFCEYLLREIGYDFDAGRLDETQHPFAISVSAGDVRVTTRYWPNFFNAGIFGSIHEGGHALYEQNISPELNGTVLHDGASMGVHESQSRFWENIVGRSYEFWERHYGELQRTFPESLGSVSLGAFYRGINIVKPSLIRIEADEVTYNLHIMLRYELEKGLIRGDIQVAELPGLWREMMRQYLGVEPKDDADGVLQDVHWSDGSFGYFPSYAIGNIYGAQIAHALERELPHYHDDIRRGDFAAIRGWLKERIHRRGKLVPPSELMRQATGEEINADYLIRYLTKKFTDLYDL